MADFYEILGITEEEKKLSNEKFQPILKKKYKALAVKWHPDRFVGKSDEEKNNSTIIDINYVVIWMWKGKQGNRQYG